MACSLVKQWYFLQQLVEIKEKVKIAAKIKIKNEKN